MGENTGDFDVKPFELRPGFSLAKYGNVLTFNFNEEFANRLHNILADSNVDLVPVLKNFNQQLMGGLGLDGGTPFKPNDLFYFFKFQHVYSVVLQREVGHSLIQTLVQFLVQNRISPALFSFVKQLEAALYPRKFDPETAYADE